MILKHQSLLVAEMILAELQQHEDFRRIARAGGHEFEQECYQNGREQGYTLVHWYFPKEDGASARTQSITFAEHRSSDNIVLYVSPHAANQSISDDAYENRQYFSPNTYYEVADSIIGHIKKLEEKK